MSITRVFFDSGKKKNKPLRKALEEAKKRPSVLLSRPEYPDLMANRAAFTSAGDGVYYWRTLDELSELPAALEDLVADRVEIVVEIPIGPDTVSVKPGLYADNATGCAVTVAESDEQLASGVKYRERLVTATGPDLAALNKYLLEVRGGRRQQDLVLG